MPVVASGAAFAGNVGGARPLRARRLLTSRSDSGRDGRGTSHGSAGDAATTKLPLEVWRVIFDYLEPRELCACATVCAAWRSLVDSLDGRTWRRHFLQRFPWVFSPEWLRTSAPVRRRCSWWSAGDEEAVEEGEEAGDPGWPEPDLQRGFWKRLFLEELMFSRAWRLDYRGREQAACVGVFRKKRALADTLRVSANSGEHRSLRTALSQAKAYATVELEAGLHEDSARLDLSRPVHLTGVEPLGGVVLSASLVLYANSVRLSNLVLRAPWFSECILQMHEGSLHIENCRFELGEVSLEFADAVCIRHCCFERCQINIGRTGPMLAEHCVFHHPDGDCINVNGPSCLPRSPTCQFLWRQCRLRLPQSPRSAPGSAQDDAPRTARPSGVESVAATPRRSTAPEGSHSLPDLRRRSQIVSRSSASIGKIREGGDEGEAVDDEEAQEAAVRSVSCLSEEEGEDDDDEEEEDEDEDEDEEDEEEEEENMDDFERNSVAADDCRPDRAAGDSPDRRHELSRRLLKRYRRSCWYRPAEAALKLPEVRQRLSGLSGGVLLHRCTFHQTRTGVTVVQGAEAAVTGCSFDALQCAVRALGATSICIFGNRVRGCSQSAVILRNGATGVVAANAIEAVQEAALEIRRRSDPVVVHNRIRYSRRCGIVCLTQSNPVIKHNEICHHGETGIHILYKADPVVSSNLVSHGKMCGIAVSEDGRGVISGNLIAFHDYCGVNVYKLGDPVLRHNYVVSGAGVGVLVREEGSGMVSNNVVHGNGKAGVCLHSPFMCQIHGNRISHNEGDGILVLADVQELDPPSPDDANLAEPNVASSRRYYLFDPSDDEDQPWTTWEQKLTVVDFNLVSCNRGCGLHAADNVPLEVRSNAFHANMGHGVSLRLPGLLASHRVIAQVAGNAVTCNAGAGLTAGLTSLAGGRVEVAGNGVYDNAGGGLLLRLSARVVENDVVGNQEAALALEGDIQVKVSHNRLHSPRGAALRMPPPASLSVRGELSHNLFFSPLPAPLLAALNAVHSPPPASASDAARGSSLRCVANRAASLPSTRRRSHPEIADAPAGSPGAARSLEVPSWAADCGLDPPPRPGRCVGARGQLAAPESGRRAELLGLETGGVVRRGTRRRQMAHAGVAGCGVGSLLCAVL